MISKSLRLILSLAFVFPIFIVFACGDSGDDTPPAEQVDEPAESDEIEPQSDSASVETLRHSVQPGDTLQALAEEHYGSEHYSRLLMHHNHLERPEDLAAGSEINIPAFEGLLEGEEISFLFELELALLLKVREDYIAIEEQLWETRRNVGRGRIDLPVALSSTLGECSNKVGIALEGFGEIREGVVYEPRGLLSQLRMLRDNLANLSTGSNDSYGYDLDMVHQRLSIALTYGIVWSRHGFR